MAAVMECVAGGHVTGGAAPGGAGGSGAVSAVAEAAAADAAGVDVFVGGGGAGQAGFRDVDEDGYGVYRQLVFGAGWEDSVVDDSLCVTGERGALSHGSAATGLQCVHQGAH